MYDMCVPCGDGLLNLRVGAIIIKDGKLLLAGNRKHPEYLYTVGGRLKFGETAAEAIVREAFEETGVRMEIDRLGFVHENYFYGDVESNLGKRIYEISLYFFMKTPADFAPVSYSFSEGGQEEFLRWISPDDPIRYYPDFLRTEWNRPERGVRHFVTVDDRPAKESQPASGTPETAVSAQIARIQKNEALLNEASQALSAYERALARFSQVQENIAALDRYYGSEDWRADFAASETGRLPASLPCGVLSEDGVWNLLERNRELLSLSAAAGDGSGHSEKR